MKFTKTIPCTVLSVLLGFCIGTQTTSSRPATAQDARMPPQPGLIDSVKELQAKVLELEKLLDVKSQTLRISQIEVRDPNKPNVGIDLTSTPAANVIFRTADDKMRAESLETRLEALEANDQNIVKQINANRKEIYTDLGTVVSVGQYNQNDNGGIHRHPHMHFDRANQEGYLAGLPNGHHHNEKQLVGSIRWMPKALKEKCDQIAAGN